MMSPLLVAGRDVEERDLVRALVVVQLRKLDPDRRHPSG